MIHFCISDFSGLSEEEICRLYVKISRDRQKKIDSIGAKKAKGERIVAGFILESMLRDTGFSQEIRYRYDSDGKPFFDWEGSPFFSISHSGRYAAVVLSDQKVGIDIEDLSKRDRTDHTAIAKRFFTPEETGWIGDDRNRFFRAWTYKEAYAKATGLLAARHLNIWDYTKVMDSAETIDIPDTLISTEYGNSFRSEATMGIHYAQFHDALFTLVSAR